MAMLSKTHPLRLEATQVPYYATIVQAINSARDGDKIVVHSGVYCEQVVIYKNIVLIGSDMDGTYVCVVCAYACVCACSVSVCIRMCSSVV